jgi:hypothetical protein
MQDQSAPELLIEERVTRLQSKAVGSVLACLDGNFPEAILAGCEESLFTKPNNLAAAVTYTTERINLIAQAHSMGPLRPQLQTRIARVKTALEQDHFGLAANVLAVQKGCTASRCDFLSLLDDANRVHQNLERQTFRNKVAQYALAKTAVATPQSMDAKSRTPFKPLSDKYSLPSADSIPAISIMVEESEAQSTEVTGSVKPHRASPKGPGAPLRVAPR